MPSIEPDDMDELMIFPLTDLDNNNEDGGKDDQNDNFQPDSRYNNNYDRCLFERSLDKDWKPSMTLRQRRYSKLGLSSGPLLKLSTNEAQTEPSLFSASASASATPLETPPSSSPRMNWMRAIRKIRTMKDPWVQFKIDRLPVETAKRHRYSALKMKWVTDMVCVKIENEPFNHGAMRSCFRLKKQSSFSRKREWKHAHNYVAKSYMQEVNRDVYFEDVRLQMDAKLWGEEYNRHNPPKKVDIFQMSIIEFTERTGSPLFHLEHFIEGNYIKYNSNSGFVEENIRLTPQAFSHFTFERSGHQLIVVDIQGVGDLWTDPQIHTNDGEGYGDGNLGTKGMALFFHSHVCNSICDSLNLSKFDLADAEVAGMTKFIQAQQSSSLTRVRGTEEVCCSPSASERVDLTSFLASHSRCRTISSCSMTSGLSGVSEEDVHSSTYEEAMTCSPRSHGFDEWRGGDSPEPMAFSPGKRQSRVRFVSESDSASSTLTEEEERLIFQRQAIQGARPSCVAHELSLRSLTLNARLGDSVLGQIHHEMAKYHDIGRFAMHEDDKIDMEAAVFHEEQAANLGVKEAILTMAYLYLGMQHDILVNAVVQETEENTNNGVEYMLLAAHAGDRSAITYIAKAYETGLCLGSKRSRDWNEAVEWYERGASTSHQDESGEFDAVMDNPVYQLKAKMAELYLEGGFNLSKDASYAGELYNEAAEEAMASMKGRLANKYYALAEEAYAQVEEE